MDPRLVFLLAGRNAGAVNCAKMNLRRGVYLSQQKEANGPCRAGPQDLQCPGRGRARRITGPALGPGHDYSLAANVPVPPGWQGNLTRMRHHDHH